MTRWQDERTDKQRAFISWQDERTDKQRAFPMTRWEGHDASKQSLWQDERTVINREHYLVVWGQQSQLSLDYQVFFLMFPYLESISLFWKATIKTCENCWEYATLLLLLCVILTTTLLFTLWLIFFNHNILIWIS